MLLLSETSPKVETKGDGRFCAHTMNHAATFVTTTRKEAIAYAKKWVDVAVKIGSPSIRTHIQRPANSTPNVRRTAESLREVAEYGAGKNLSSFGE